jgi:hypothetical protein
MSAKQVMGMVNLGLSIFGKLQQINIRNEKLKAINQQNRNNDMLIAEFENTRGTNHGIQHSTRSNQPSIGGTQQQRRTSGSTSDSSRHEQSENNIQEW